MWSEPVSQNIFYICLDKSLEIVKLCYTVLQSRMHKSKMKLIMLFYCHEDSAQSNIFWYC